MGIRSEMRTSPTPGELARIVQGSVERRSGQSARHVEGQGHGNEITGNHGEDGAGQQGQAEAERQVAGQATPKVYEEDGSGTPGATPGLMMLFYSEKVG